MSLDITRNIITDQEYNEKVTHHIKNLINFLSFMAEDNKLSELKIKLDSSKINFTSYNFSLEPITSKAYRFTLDFGVE
jgi:hypothetical protein